MLDLLREKGGRTPTVSGLQEVIKWEEDGVYFCPFNEELSIREKRLEDYYQMSARWAKESRNPETVKKIEKKASQVRQEIAKKLKETGYLYLGKKLIAGPDFHSGQLFAWREKDVVGPARFMLSRMVSKKLAGGINLELKGDTSGFILRIVLRDLLTALWLGLLFEILGKIKLKRCPICGTWFEASHAPQRVLCDKRGSGCRQRASRLRKKLRALLDEGKTREEAARELDVAPALVEFLLGT